MKSYVRQILGNEQKKGAGHIPLIDLQNGMKTYYERMGNGVPIVFVHPPGMGLVTFHYQRPLSKDYDIILYDIRGNGQSSSSNDPITMSLLSEDLNHLLESLSIEQAYICGYSNGGSIAQHFALSYPNKVRGLILIGGFSEVTSPLLHAEFLLGIKVAKLGMLPLLAKTISNAHAPSKTFKKHLYQYMLKTNRKTLIEMYESGVEYRSTDRLHEINVPVLLVYGQHDYYVHHYKHHFLQNIEKVDVIYIANVSHQVPTKQAPALNNVISQFIR
ncbi:alpha/beta fold hydrolase [Bacillus kexueae]|uniref:alpha/beta fold hydrolase n=1 Tax=Aeribacillus kexueae TaxID=2078952 RepID=UPI001FAFB6F4|nr:alpha/beta hydrolase [Bacillus kexueae]